MVTQAGLTADSLRRDGGQRQATPGLIDLGPSALFSRWGTSCDLVNTGRIFRGELRRPPGRGRPQGALRRSAHRRTVPLESLEPRVVLAGDLLIAEMMAVNDQTLKDEDGSYSDWLEIYNSGAGTVDLTGWHLTDRLNDRTQWTFPGGSLGPGESLLVFASGKDRREVGEELHTNFRLSEGEYLGLYLPDGRTVSDEYPAIPPQYADVSYGIGQIATDRTLVDDGASVRARFPSSAAEDLPASTWTSATFDDGTWTPLTTGIGYDADPGDGDFGPWIAANGDVSVPMQGHTASAYVRSEFQITGEQRRRSSRWISISTTTTGLWLI